jgi:predicted HTH domain antitoxin
MPTIEDAMATEEDRQTESRDARIDSVLASYSRGGMSFAAAAKMAGVSRDELARAAAERGLEPPFSHETVLEELS